jgi:O-acetyl-ADP-ribose deacetylase (regulator of RNase III)
MLNSIQGDLVKLAKQGFFDYIIHGCNCYHTMRSGIAGQIAREFPLVIEADKSTLFGDREKLGSWSSIKVIENGYQFSIINAYTQFRYGLNEDLFEYAAFDKFLSDFELFLLNDNFSKKRIGFPKIGAGLAGGNWTYILSQIERFAQNQNVTVVEFVNEIPNQKNS